MTVFAWVIEAPSNPPMRAIVYWDGENWSSNNARAVRFSRQVDADRILINLAPEKRVPNMKTVEHGWEETP